MSCDIHCDLEAQRAPPLLVDAPYTLLYTPDSPRIGGMSGRIRDEVFMGLTVFRQKHPPYVAIRKLLNRLPPVRDVTFRCS